jgi:hypothetical protein
VPSFDRMEQSYQVMAALALLSSSESQSPSEIRRAISESVRPSCSLVMLVAFSLRRL